jgi:hypothetical protein
MSSFLQARGKPELAPAALHPADSATGRCAPPAPGGLPPPPPPRAHRHRPRPCPLTLPPPPPRRPFEGFEGQLFAAAAAEPAGMVDSSSSGSLDQLAPEQPSRTLFVKNVGSTVPDDDILAVFQVRRGGAAPRALRPTAARLPQQQGRCGGAAAELPALPGLRLQPPPPTHPRARPPARRPTARCARCTRHASTAAS